MIFIGERYEVFFLEGMISCFIAIGEYLIIHMEKVEIKNILGGR